jgi:REP element-mobilizing transposase RayT
MAQSLSRMLTHLIFSTKDRVTVLDGEIRPELHAYLAGILDQIDCPPLQVGGVSDHVHLFFGLSRTITIATL